MIIKPLALEGFCNATQSSFGNAALVRFYNPNTASPFLITLASNSTTNVSSITIAPGESIFISKTPNWLMSCNTGVTSQVLATPVAFKGN